MKYIILILLSAFFGCNTDNKTVSHFPDTLNNVSGNITDTAISYGYRINSNGRIDTIFFLNYNKK